MQHLSVVENVMLGQHARQGGLRSLLLPVTGLFSSTARREAIAELEDAGLDIDPNGSVSGLPYGIRKRIEVVRALMSRPDVLMLDEPAAGLNPKETAELSEFLKQRARDGLTLLIVEHDMGFVRNLCERTVVLNFGHVIYDGNTASVQDDTAVREAYLGTKAASAGQEAGRAA
jgi:branched-chain amino acid transport system ATP-binding protein